MKSILKFLRQFFTALIILIVSISIIIVPPFLLMDFETFGYVWIFLMVFLGCYLAMWHSFAQKLSPELSYLQRLRSSFQEATKLFLWAVIILVGLVFLGFLADEQSTAPAQVSTYTQGAYTPVYYQNGYYVRPVSTYGQSSYSTSGYKYNSRTGGSGNYGYNYDVEGYSDSGDYFYGEVDTSGKYGDGYVYDDYGNEVYVETEWVDYGVLEATDEYGNSYEFEVY